MLECLCRVLSDRGLPFATLKAKMCTRVGKKAAFESAEVGVAAGALTARCAGGGCSNAGAKVRSGHQQPISHHHVALVPGNQPRQTCIRKKQKVSGKVPLPEEMQKHGYV